VTRTTAAAALFLSGAAALVFQLLWIKQLTLVVGVDVYAVTTAVSAFFAGLAIGSVVIGRRADTTARPLRLYAALEIGIGALGIGSTIALAHSAGIFAALEAAVGPPAWVLLFVLAGLPAVLMGGTLPVMVRATASEDVDRAGGALYAANTTGAIAGAIAAPFVLIPALGVQGSALAAAALNVIAAVIAARLDAHVATVAGAPAAASKTTRGSPDATLALQLYAIAGGIALGYEVVWSQAVVLLASTRVFAFAIVLATYLAGLAIGSAIYTRLADRVRQPWSVFGLLIGAAALAAMLEIASVGPWLMNRQSDVENAVRAATGNELAAMCARFAIAALGIVFVPTLLLGAAFPAALRLTAETRRAGRDVGRVLALNTAGGIAGSLVTGFLLIPSFGLVRTLGALAIAAAIVGVVAVFRDRPSGLARGAIVVVAVAVVVAAVAIPEDHLARLLTLTRQGRLVFYAESAGGAVAVVEQPGGDATLRRLYIQGVSNSGDAMTSLRYMRLQAMLPLLIHRGEPRSALVIGLGTGITAGTLLAYPGLERRVCAELLPAVVQASPLFAGTFQAAADPRLEIRVRDGRRELLRSADRYDLITLEPPPPSAQGVVNLYSRDFYELARRRLEPNGIVAQWWPLPTQNDEDSRSLVRSFVDVFPYASLWTTELHEMLLVGSPDPMVLDAGEIARRFAQPGVTSALNQVGVRSAPAVVATWISGRDGLDRYARGAAPVTDDRPRIEYAAWTRRDEFGRVLPAVLALQGEPPLVNADAAFVSAMRIERARLRRFYDAGLLASRGDRDGAVALLQQVLDEDATNPYYRWMAGLPAL
jgi:predicted membrane-bound spermidine synthase